MKHQLGIESQVRCLSWPAGLRTRILNRFAEAGIHTIADLKSKKESDLLRLRHFGRRCLAAVNNALSGAGFPRLDSRRYLREREHRLIFSAPEMLEVLRALADAASYYDYSNGDEPLSEVVAARALIARIEGKP